jgi:D-3-phosphoglycerate dehydrogenase
VLAERLGWFLAQVSGGALTEISVRFSGAIADWRTELIRNAAIKGVLNQLCAENANLVNAAAIAAERGIGVHESKKERSSIGGAGNVVSLMLRAGDRTHAAKGAVLHGSVPRLLQLDDIDIEAPLAQNLIFVRNLDVPGVIGRIGTVLGERGINIGNFALGRAERRDGDAPVEAIAVVQVDEPAPEKVVEELRRIEAMRDVRSVRL